VHGLDQGLLLLRIGFLDVLLTQSLFFFVARALTLQGRQYLVGGHFADQQKQRGVAGLQGLSGIPHELVVDADIGEPAAYRLGGCSLHACGRPRSYPASWTDPLAALYQPGGITDDQERRIIAWW
jgi:hypothetical protein